MGPIVALPRPVDPRAEQLWQDPVPAVDHELDRRRRDRRAEGEDPRLGPVDLAARRHRLGVGGLVPRHRQARRRERRAGPPRAAEGLGVATSRPSSRARCRRSSRSRATSTTSQSGGKRVSLADLIVLGGCAAVEQAAQERRVTTSPSPSPPGAPTPPRSRPTSESFAVLEPTVDGFPQLLPPGRAAAAGARAARARLHADG